METLVRLSPHRMAVMSHKDSGLEPQKSTWGPWAFLAAFVLITWTIARFGPALTNDPAVMAARADADQLRALMAERRELRRRVQDIQVQMQHLEEELAAARSQRR